MKKQIAKKRRENVRTAEEEEQTTKHACCNRGRNESLYSKKESYRRIFSAFLLNILDKLGQCLNTVDEAIHPRVTAEMVWAAHRRNQACVVLKMCNLSFTAIEQEGLKFRRSQPLRNLGVGGRCRKVQAGVVTVWSSTCWRKTSFL